MIDDESYPTLTRPVKFLVRLIMALIRFFILGPFRVMFFISILIAALFARKDINLYKINSLITLVINLFAKVI